MSGERLIIPEIPKPHDEAERQLPTKDIPTNKGLSLNSETLVRSSATPEDVQEALANLPQARQRADSDKG